MFFQPNRSAGEGGEKIRKLCLKKEFLFNAAPPPKKNSFVILVLMTFFLHTLRRLEVEIRKK